MKNLMSAVLGIGLLASVATFAQDTGGCKTTKAAKKGAKIESKTRKVHKGHKGTGKDEKSKKGSTTTTPPPK